MRTTAAQPARTRDRVDARPRFAALALGGALLAGSVSGCSMLEPVDTQIQYQPADGVNTLLGELKISNLLVVAPNAAAPGVLSAQIVNQGDRTVKLRISDPSGHSSTAVMVRGNHVVKLWNGIVGNTLLAQVGKPPGAMVQVQLSTAAAATSIQIPVMLNDRYYATVSPSQGCAGR